MRVLSTVQLGDLPGHDFHGNQWTGGSGSADALIAANPRQPGEDSFAWQARIIKGLPEQQQSDILFKVRETYPAVPFVAQGIQTWCSEHGLPAPPENCNQIPVNQKEADAVAAYFEKTPDQSGDPRVQAAYADFRTQSAEMYQFLTKPESEGGLGVKVEFTNKVNPYPDAASQAADLRDNHHVYMESGLGGAHEATMTQRQYDEFRAVHDVFGHAGIGGGFDRHGEYQAWFVHSSMYTGAGRDAMSTEYHGVNSAAWTGNPGTPGTGKSILLPEKWANPPWDRVGLTASAGLNLDELIDKLGLDAKFAREYDVLPWHPIENRPVISSAFPLEFYSADQPRDKRGRFGEGGGTGSTPKDWEDSLQQSFPKAEITISGEVRRALADERQAGFNDPGKAGPISESIRGATAAARDLARDYPDIANTVALVGLVKLQEGVLGEFIPVGGNRSLPTIYIDPLQIAGSRGGGSFSTIPSMPRASDKTGYLEPPNHEEIGYGVVAHEFGHALDYDHSGRGFENGSDQWTASSLKGETSQAGSHISSYAMKSDAEYFAEAFAASRIGFSDRLTAGDKKMLRSAGVTASASSSTAETIKDSFEGSIVFAPRIHPAKKTVVSAAQPLEIFPTAKRDSDV